jgi:hypothetical protein
MLALGSSGGEDGAPFTPTESDTGIEGWYIYIPNGDQMVTKW